MTTLGAVFGQSHVRIMVHTKSDHLTVTTQGVH